MKLSFYIYSIWTKILVKTLSQLRTIHRWNNFSLWWQNYLDFAVPIHVWIFDTWSFDKPNVRYREKFYIWKNFSLKRQKWIEFWIWILNWIVYFVPSQFIVPPLIHNQNQIHAAFCFFILSLSLNMAFLCDLLSRPDFFIIGSSSLRSTLSAYLKSLCLRTIQAHLVDLTFLQTYLK